MSRTQERKKLRQEYLKKRTMGYGKAYASLYLPLLATIIAGFLGGKVIISLTSGNYILTGICLAVLAALLVIVPLRWILRSVRYAAKMYNEAETLSPITPDTLPAEEVLVRGSEVPLQAQRQLLVRPATPEQEPPTEQPLRSGRAGE